MVQVEDYGVKLNARIAKARERVNSLVDKLCEAQDQLAELEQKKQEAQKECGFCEDCSMCLGS